MLGYYVKYKRLGHDFIYKENQIGSVEADFCSYTNPNHGSQNCMLTCRITLF